MIRSNRNNSKNLKGNNTNTNNRTSIDPILDLTKTMMKRGKATKRRKKKCSDLVKTE